MNSKEEQEKALWMAYSLNSEFASGYFYRLKLKIQLHWALFKLKHFGNFGKSGNFQKKIGIFQKIAR